MVDAIKELLKIYVNYPQPPFLHVPLRLTHGIVRATPRPEAVAVLRKRRVESWLQDLQYGLLDEPIEHRRDTELALPAIALWDRSPLHRLRLVRAREQLLAERRPVHAQMIGKLSNGHPVHAGTALVMPHSLQRELEVAAFNHRLHQPARSWALVSVGRRTRFHASGCSRGFTPTLLRWLHVCGLLWRFASEIHRRFALLIVQPFAVNNPTTTASADFSLRRGGLQSDVALSGMRRDLPR